MIRLRSQLSPLGRAMVTAIETDTTLGAILAGDKIYNKLAPPGSPFPYCVLALSNESEDTDFNEPGTLARQRIDVWGLNLLEKGDTEILEIWDGLYGLFHKQPLAVEGFQYVIGTMALLAVMLDPDGKTNHAIAEYTIISRQV